MIMILIDKEQTYQALSEYYHHTGTIQHMALREALEKVPVVDAEPVRHGRWIHGREVCREYIGITLVLVQYKHWECSACGFRTDNEPIWKYCPNCGAKMDEQEAQNGR